MNVQDKQTRFVTISCKKKSYIKKAYDTYDDFVSMNSRKNDDNFLNILFASI